MAKQTLREKLDQMVGRFFMINGNQEKIEDWALVDEDTITIKTDQDEYEYSYSLVDEGLKRDFLPIDDGLDTVHTSLPQLVGDTKTLVQLKDIMMENIKNIKADKDYVPQAKEISKSVGTIIDLAKTEIEYQKMISKL